MNIAFKVVYTGGRYLGWQKTKMGPSIEEELEKALQQILQEKIALQAASRTDAGVHAEGQLVNFFTQKEVDLEKLLKSLNALLPKDISAREMEIATDDFHPTLNALGKEYHYYICNSPFQSPFHTEFSWHFSYLLNADAMQCATDHLLGYHDFSAFTNEANENPHCTLINIRVVPLEEQRLRIELTGDRFLYKMVRNLVGTLVYVGCQKIADIPSILASRDRRTAGVTAPAHGLCLKRVFYETLPSGRMDAQYAFGRL